MKMEGEKEAWRGPIRSIKIVFIDWERLRPNFGLENEVRGGLEVAPFDFGPKWVQSTAPRGSKIKKSSFWASILASKIHQNSAQKGHTSAITLEQALDKQCGMKLYGFWDFPE